jgi:hypothetical protein
MRIQNHRIQLLVASVIFVCGFLLVNAVSAAPLAPQGFSASPRSACAIQLSWTQPDVADHFRLRSIVSVNPPQSFDIRALGAGPEQSGYLSGSGPFSFIDTYLWNQTNDGPKPIYMDPATTRRYELSACDSANSCSMVAAGPAMTPSLPSFVYGPQSLVAMGTSTSRVSLSFVPSGALSQKFPSYGGFWVDRTPTGTGFPQFVPASHNVNGIFFFDDLGAAPTVRYTYTARFFESDEFCDITRPAEISLSDPAVVVVPIAPTTFTAAYSNITKAVTLTWNDTNSGTNNETSFRIFRNTENDFTKNTTGQLTLLSDTIAPDTTTFTDSGANEDRQFHYQVQACMRDAATGALGCSIGKTAGVYTSPMPATDVRATIIYSSSSASTSYVFLTWNAHGSNISVKRYAGPSDRFGLVLPNCGPTQCTDTWNDLKNNYSGVPWRSDLYRYTVGESTGPASTSLSVNLDIRKVLSGNI